jgi:hypothetical protein
MANGNGSFTITLVDDNGTEKDKQCKAGDKLSSIVPSGMVALLNGVKVERDAELRANDKVAYMRKSGKARS